MVFHEVENLSGDRLDAAIKNLRAITIASPDLPSVWVQLAESLEKSGASAEAVDAWRMAHRLVPNSPRISAAVRRMESDHSPAPESKPTKEPTNKQAESRRAASLDIDLLISELQSGRTLTEGEHHDSGPDPTSQSEDEELATETLAGIFESQKLFAEAAKIYDLLADREDNTGKAAVLRAQAKDLRKQIVQPG